MSENPSKPGGAEGMPPVSAFGGPVAELIAQRMLAPPGRPGALATLGRYDILRSLGGGGMGVVLLARDNESGQMTAVKMIRPELAGEPQAARRFVKEAGHLQKLAHKNIVSALEVADRPEGVYFVMPFFERGSLASRIKPGTGLDAKTALEIATGRIGEGLQFAHQRGIITPRSPSRPTFCLTIVDTCRLGDFGLARTLFNDSIIDVGRDQFEGTAPYMSPGVAARQAPRTPLRHLRLPARCSTRC